MTYKYNWRGGTSVKRSVIDYLTLDWPWGIWWVLPERASSQLPLCLCNMAHTSGNLLSEIAINVIC